MSKILAISAALIFINLNNLQSSYAAGICCMSESVSKQEWEVLGTIHDFGKILSHYQWKRNENDNSLLSPFSITTVLNLLILGTKGESNSEIKGVLNYPNDLQDNAIHEVYENIYSSMQQTVNGVKIDLFTKLFIQKDFSVLDSYTNVAKRSYFSDVEKLDFRGSPGDSTRKINNWVSNSTEGKIGEVFPQPVGADTVCVLVNVIYFNATWENQFYSGSTRNGTFYSGAEKIIIPLMNTDMTASTIKENRNKFEMLVLPYKGNRYSMYIIKPFENNLNALREIEDLIDLDILDNLICGLQSGRVFVTIPRMKVSSQIDLKSDLMYFGAKKIFKDDADFGRLTNNSVYVTDVVHKTILEITEAGTTAAAVTVAKITLRSNAPSFVVDRPFLLFIRDDVKGVILFWARVIKPEPLI